jgi:hypothetical protein
MPLRTMIVSVAAASVIVAIIKQLAHPDLSF